MFTHPKTLGNNPSSLLPLHLNKLRNPGQLMKKFQVQPIGIITEIKYEENNIKMHVL